MMALKQKIVILLCFICASMSIKAQIAQQMTDYPISPISFTKVKITDRFWKQRLNASRNVTIPLAFKKCEETGRYNNFLKAANPSDTIKVGGLAFDDTDVYKTIEGASYLLQTYPDKTLRKYIDSVLMIVASAQESDGYLYTSRTMNPKHPHEWAGDKRWEKVEEISHELYNLGHMVEGAIAHYQATGKRNFLNIAIRYADCVCNAIGEDKGQLIRVPGHQIAEMALVKLYLVTKNERYLKQAKFFLDKRGKTARREVYNQTHKPVLEQDEAVGHAVRAVYMYSGMTDVGAIMRDSSYINTVDRIWENVISKKYYITGGIGARHEGEAFGDNYELPNESAYCETCAAIGNVYWNHRLFLMHGDAKYYDVLERTLYNGLISGVAMDGGSFFYPNPLACNTNYERKPWFGCACCPSNISRFIPSLPGYIYATHNKDLYVNLFMSNTSNLKIAGKQVVISQQTDYPWNGNVKIIVDKNNAESFNLKIRIPGWVRNEVVPSDLYSFLDTIVPTYDIKVNGITVKSKCSIKNGYLSINRSWKKGDKIEIHFDMTPRIVKANQNVKADNGCVAIERGPLVYCAESVDNDFNINNILISHLSKIETIWEPNLLNGINRLRTDAQLVEYNTKGQIVVKDVELSLIPYYAWAHRGVCKMSVWFPSEMYSIKLLRNKQ